MKGLVVINGYPRSEKFLRQGERIANALRTLGVETDVVKNGDIFAVVHADGHVEVNPKGYDFAVYLDKDKYLGRALESEGVRLFNSMKAIEICDDKTLTSLALKDAGVRLAETIPAPLCYTPNATVNEGFLKNVEKTLGFPMVVKANYGSFGDGVQLVHGSTELIETAQKLLHVPHCFQRFVSESSGRDIRVVVIGGKAVAGMERIAKKGEFRSNIELGGEGRTIELTEDVKTVAERTAKALELDYCGVDLLEGKDGAIVCEVNSNAFFEGLEKTTGVDIAKEYAKHILASFPCKYLDKVKGI